ncbi:MAG: MBL fold metallo-hydrolase [Clostridia bacterium]|nr:MBL fold metallo-hydrolase [Clostridia bacterium]
MELRFCPLFSGSSGNSLYLGCNDTHLLVDAGMSGAKITTEMERVGLKPGDLSGILITHEHADHIAGAGILSRRYDLPIYANEATWAAMRDKLGNISEKNIMLFETGADFHIGSLDITPFSTPHDAAEPVGYSFYAGRNKLSIATDLGTVKESWMRHIEESDLVLLEANHDVDMLKAGRYPYDLKRRILGNKGHLSNDSAGKAAVDLVKRGVRTIVLGHLSGENNFPELAYQSVCCALQSEGIEPGRDVALSVASRDGASGLYVIGGARSEVR